MNRLVLSPAGRRLVLLFIVLGVLAWVGLLGVGIISGARATHTARQLDRNHAGAVAAFQGYGAETQTCAATRAGLSCLHDADLRLATAVERFRNGLDGLKFPSNAVSDAEQVRTDVTKIDDLLHFLASAPAPQYQRSVGQLEILTNQFDADYQTLRDQLPA